MRQKVPKKSATRIFMAQPMTTTVNTLGPKGESGYYLNAMNRSAEENAANAEAIRVR